MVSTWVTLAVIASGLAVVWAWTVVIRRLATGVPVVKFESHYSQRWGLVDILFTVCLFTGIMAIAGAILSTLYQMTPSRPSTPEEQAAVMLASSLATMVTFLVSLLWLESRYGCSLSHLGLRTDSALSDLKLGAISFLILAPVVYGIQLVLIQWVDPTHPLIELLKEHPEFRYFAMSGFSAVLVAPIAEEYFFRMLLQGWLQRMADSLKSESPSLLLGDLDGRSAQPEWLRVPPADAPRTGRTPSAWPILASASLFAAAHMSHGPAPIPLFVFGLGLGYLYQRTQRLLPCIVLHCSLNACSLLLFALSTAGSHGSN